MKIYVLLHFEHKNDVTIVIKLHRATRLRLVVMYLSEWRHKRILLLVLDLEFKNIPLYQIKVEQVQANFMPNMQVSSVFHC